MAERPDVGLETRIRVHSKLLSRRVRRRLAPNLVSQHSACKRRTRCACNHTFGSLPCCVLARSCFKECPPISQLSPPNIGAPPLRSHPGALCCETPFSPTREMCPENEGIDIAVSPPQNNCRHDPPLSHKFHLRGEFRLAYRHQHRYTPVHTYAHTNVSTRVLASEGFLQAARHQH